MLTNRQKEIYEFIKSYQEKNLRSPSFKEIKEHFNFGSLNAVYKHLEALTEKKYIKRDSSARGIVLLDSVLEKLQTNHEENTKQIPLYGDIPAGDTSFREELLLDEITLPRYFLKSEKEHFLLKVKGDSLDLSGILDGDIVLIENNLSPRNGDIIVALVDGKNTLKIYEKDKAGVIHLYPNSSNPLNQEIIPTHELVIQGIVRACFRKY